MQLCIIHDTSCCTARTTCRWRSPSPPPCGRRAGGHRGDPGALSTRRKRLQPVHHTSHTRPATDPPPRRAGALIGEWHSRMGNKARRARSQDTVRCSCRPFATPYSAPTRHQLLDASQTSLTGGRCSPMASRGPQSPSAALQLHPPRTVTNEHPASSSRGCGLRATRRASYGPTPKPTARSESSAFPPTPDVHVLKQHNHPHARPHHPRTPPHHPSVICFGFCVLYSMKQSLNVE